MSKKEYPAKLTTGYYRVREIWEDESSQLGAYRLLANAKAKCDENPGSRVFDNDGNVIYPEEAVPVTGAEESEEQPVLDKRCDGWKAGLHCDEVHFPIRQKHHRLPDLHP